MALHIEQVAPGFDKTCITNFFFFFFYEIIVVVLSSVSSKNKYVQSPVPPPCSAARRARKDHSPRGRLGAVEREGGRRVSYLPV